MAYLGDFYAFIEILGQHHGFLGAEIEFIHRVLLHGGGGVRRLRLSLLAGLGDGNDFRFLPGNPGYRGIGFGLVVKLGVCALDLAQLCFEKIALLGAVQRFHGPILFRFECTDFFFSFANEAGRHRLHAAGGKAPVHLAPQPGRELVAHQTVQHAAGLLGVYAIEIDGLGVRDGLTDRRRCDFVERNAHIVLRIHIEKLGEMPGNRFAFAIRVRCQKDVLALVRCLLQIFDDCRALGGIHILRRKAIVDLYAQGALRQVAQVSHGRHDFIIWS